MMSRITKLELRKHSIRDKELRKCLGIESLGEILVHIDVLSITAEDEQNTKWTAHKLQIPCHILNRYIQSCFKVDDQRMIWSQVALVDDDWNNLSTAILYDARMTEDSSAVYEDGTICPL